MPDSGPHRRWSHCRQMDRQPPRWQLCQLEALSQDMLGLLKSGLYADLYFSWEGEDRHQQIGRAAEADDMLTNGNTFSNSTFQF